MASRDLDEGIRPGFAPGAGCPISRRVPHFSHLLREVGDSCSFLQLRLLFPHHLPGAPFLASFARSGRLMLIPPVPPSLPVSPAGCPISRIFCEKWETHAHSSSSAFSSRITCRSARLMRV